MKSNFILEIVLILKSQFLTPNVEPDKIPMKETCKVKTMTRHYFGKDRFDKQRTKGRNK